MQITKCKIELLPCLDSVEMAEVRKDELTMPWSVASELGRSACRRFLGPFRDVFYV